MNYLKILYKSVLYCFLNTCIATAAFSQCPQSGLKIISKDCENPKGLAVASINCAEMKVKWLGNKNQSYVVKASAVSSADRETAIPVKGSEAVCDNSGNCTASLEVAEGTTVDWSVEALCTGQGVVTYSEAVDGPETYIPVCNKVRETNTATGLQAYPNPSTGILTVDYTGSIKGTFHINIYDVNGKQVFTRSTTASSKTNNQYTLNLNTLTPGTYLLETTNGKDKRQIKFVLMSK